jgi:hypothetical protein
MICSAKTAGKKETKTHKKTFFLTLTPYTLNLLSKGSNPYTLHPEHYHPDPYTFKLNPEPYP